jgi:hypothetical protein
MEGEALLPLKWPNCFQVTESLELFDSSGRLVTTNALAVTVILLARCRLLVTNPNDDSCQCCMR